jgi:hypothetical protein
MHHLIIAILAVLGSGAVFGSLVYSGTDAGAKDENLGTFGPYVDQDLSVTYLTGGGAITQTHGTVVIMDAGVGVYTLAAPVTGSPAAGGNDGQKLVIIDGTGHAHTVTTPANAINGSKHILTCAGNIGDEATVRASKASWLCSPTTTAWVIS